jgi:hypothetical protein
MKAQIKSPRFCPPLLLPKGERMEVRGSENPMKVKSANPHPTLSLAKGEAKQAPTQSKEALNPLE